MRTNICYNYDELVEGFMDACYHNIQNRSNARAEIFLSYSPTTNAYYIFFKTNDDKGHEFLFTIEQAKKLVVGFSNSIQFISDPEFIRFIRALIHAFSSILRDYQIMVLQRH